MNRDEFQSLHDGLYKKEWVVYCKPPFGNAEKTLEYLGRYTHRVAISNERIKGFQGGKVCFKWRDYHDGNKTKIMTVDAAEFIRRFLMHVLPESFVKIRHYGILSNRNRNSKLKICEELLGVKEEGIDEINQENDGIEKSIYDCPICNKGRMVKKEELPSQRGIGVKSKYHAVWSKAG